MTKKRIKQYLNRKGKMQNVAMTLTSTGFHEDYEPLLDAWKGRFNEVGEWLENPPVEGYPGSAEVVEAYRYRIHNGFPLQHPEDQIGFNGDPVGVVKPRAHNFTGA